jgi:hypothetical protein
VSRFGEKTGGGVLPIKPWTRAKFGIPFLRFSLHPIVPSGYLLNGARWLAHTTMLHVCAGVLAWKG